MRILLLILILPGCGARSQAEPTTRTPSGESRDADAHGNEEGELEAGPIDAAPARVLGVAAADPREPPAVALPREHVVAAAASTADELADGEAAYARVLAAPLGSSEGAADVSQTVDLLHAQVRAAYSELRSLDEAFEAGATESAALRPRSLLRRADARDALADRLLAISVAMPVDLRRAVRAFAIERASTEVLDEYQRAWDERTRALLAVHARELWCQAALLYEQALEGATDDVAARAREQRERYGEAFLQSCGAR